MSANDQQVGGGHYRKVPGEQHWDRLVRLFGLPAARCYFVGNITAYVERYQDKNGIEDLKKARHYLDKLIELEEAEVAVQPPPPQPANPVGLVAVCDDGLCCCDCADPCPLGKCGMEVRCTVKELHLAGVQTIKGVRK